MFISWLNLDLGVETCFFDGMDAYEKAWLQFAFPVYIWLIALVIIVLSHYSMRASRLFGNNSVPVLATLFLLSYTKLLRAVISSFSISHIEFLNTTRISVWERDGNVYYLSGKHIPLFVLALGVLLLLLFPLTLVLTSIQWLNRGTHYRVLCWVMKLKPFFDAFTGPLKDKHRYWVGTLLLARCALLLVFFTYTTNGDGTALVSISFVVSVILAIAGSKYRNFWLTFLEHSYTLNLCLLSVATVYLQFVTFSDNREIVTIISVGIAFLQFAATVIYHTYTRLREPLKKVVAHLKRTRAKKRDCELQDVATGTGGDSDTEQDLFGEHHPLIPPTVTEIYLPPLQDDCELREPLLDYLSDD